MTTCQTLRVAWIRTTGRLAALFVLLASACGCSRMVSDVVLLEQFNEKRAAWEQLKELSYGDLPTCRHRMRTSLKSCPPFGEMAGERLDAYLGVARELHLTLSQVQFSSFLFTAVGRTNSALDVCLKVVMDETGFPITLRQKSVLYCERPPDDWMIEADLDEYLREHSRETQQTVFRPIGDGWYLGYAPL